MKILIPSYLSENIDVRRHRKMLHQKQLNELHKIGLSSQTIIAYNNYHENDFDDRFTYIPAPKILNNALSVLMKYAKENFDSEMYMLLDDDILIDKKAWKRINYIADNSPFWDALSLHEFNSHFKKDLYFEETFDMCNSAMLLNSDIDYPDYANIEEILNPTIEWGIQCYLKGLKCYRIKGSDFLQNLSPDVSTINRSKFEDRLEDIGKSYWRLTNKYKVKPIKNPDSFRVTL